LFQRPVVIGLTATGRSLVDNQIVSAKDREPLAAGQEDGAESSIGTTRFLGSDDGPWVYYSERPAGAVIAPHQHRSARTEFLVEGEIAFRFAQPPEDGSPQEITYGAGTMSYVNAGVVYGYEVLEAAKILLWFDTQPGINYL
jgi:hypothetical protein